MVATTAAASTAEGAAFTAEGAAFTAVAGAAAEGAAFTAVAEEAAEGTTNFLCAAPQSLHQHDRLKIFQTVCVAVRAATW